MIYKRYGDNHIKLWNKELEQLFNIKQDKNKVEDS
jgi:hypothetical protein